ncbi:coxsackievirus and adenovirus receptor homolog [Denticeps clupeoides]|uniref:Ig-like domain-containing protein n=1 Tax=Denticeps clupeoides TaxID=299321 RepID=A0AAY4CJ55_9TELE|nr:coxsackievirus and adenovirus receptor [Denticeps clupeoides]
MDLATSHHVFLLVVAVTGTVYGLDILSSGTSTVEKASGETVKLDCQFTLSPEDTGPLDIEWSIQPSDNQDEEKVVIMYSGDRAYPDYYTPLKGRAHFNSPDPKNGDASMVLLSLKASDTATYQCKVKKVPGIKSKKTLLSVILAPSKPRCYADGSTEVGKNVALRCVSSEGTSPIKYEWTKLSGDKLLPASAGVDPVSGVLNIRNASAATSGTYRCLAQNRVGQQDCVLELSITPPPNTAGVIAATVICILIALILIAIILFCCLRARNKKKYEKEISYEIREDVPPPKSRVSTARSFTSVGSQRSSLGSMSPSNLHEYSKPQYDKIPSEEYDRPPSHAPLPPPSRVAGPNLSRMGAVPVMIPAQNRDGSIV